ncbi:MAG TPA: maleylpyruvate isomerase family mycothiol-dependent enzyme [Mycobacterium sp.]|nr:maleylpyruvate isomerase family mycothiol-dependent enzyme [Mycobacterium sp.]
MDFATALADENRAFVELVFANDLATQVPTCPGWALKQLYRHVGGGDRWAAQIVGDRMADRLDFADIRDGRAPQDPDEARAWVAGGPAQLIDAVAAVGPDTSVWTFLGLRPAQWWIRRRLHEVLVHRADAALAVGAAFEPSPELAADAVSEWLDIAIARGGIDGTLHLHATDDGLGERGEWTVAGNGWSHSHGKGDAALRGPATDLLLALTRRTTVAGTPIELFGDQAVWDSWLAATPF